MKKIIRKKATTAKNTIEELSMDDFLLAQISGAGNTGVNRERNTEHNNNERNGSGNGHGGAV